jgi:hypothetical protein
MSTNGRRNALLDEQLATVETLELRAKMGGVLCKLSSVYGSPNIDRDRMDIREAELLEFQEQICAVQAAAEHGDNGIMLLSILGNMLKAFNRSFALRSLARLLEDGPVKIPLCCLVAVRSRM